MAQQVFNYGIMPFADSMMAQRIAYNSSGYAEYIGYAAPGTNDDDQAWMISKLVYSDTSVISKLWADGTNDQSKNWNNREGYTYR